MNKGRVFLVTLSATDDSASVSEKQSGFLLLIRTTFLHRWGTKSSSENKLRRQYQDVSAEWFVEANQKD